MDFYVHVAPVMLPHLRERPLTMKRFPMASKASLFEKRVPSHTQKWVPSVDVSASDGQDVIPFVCQSCELAWAANLGTIEFHVPLWHIGRRRKLPPRRTTWSSTSNPGEGTSIVNAVSWPDT